VQRLLVTGGAGYVGSKLIPVLLDMGYTVRVLDWFLFDPDVFNHLVTHPRLELIKGDIRDQACVDRSLRMIDTVIHLAAISNDPSGDLYPSLTRQVNVDAVCYLVEAAQRSGAHRFINTSSASVYGITKGVASEEHPLKPQSLYAICKIESEAIVRTANSRAFTTVNIRPATLCGHAPRLRLDLIVNAMTYHALYKKKMTVFGGTQKRPILCLQDMINAYLLLLAADADKIGGQTFNIGSENYRIIEIAYSVREILNVQAEVEVLPTLDTRSYHISSEKSRSILGFKASYTIADAIYEIKEAFDSGSIPNPNLPKYRNVQFMSKKNLRFSTTT
jgi:nucleoside-diphosphate-sugar epimerase